MSNLMTLTQSLSAKLNMNGADSAELMQTLKDTAFKGGATDAQLVALMVVANQYGLNPWTKEIYAFPDKGAIIPVVGVDGWNRIMNEHPQFDGIEFEQNAESCTAVIYRKDRSHPIKVTEWLSECKKGSPAWSSHPKRMLRHRALMQCARIAFGFSISDPDDVPAEVVKNMGEVEQVKSEPQPYSQADFDANIGKWTIAIENEKITADDLIAKIETKGQLSDEQLKTLREIKSKVIDADGVVENAPPINVPSDDQDENIPPF